MPRNYRENSNRRSPSPKRRYNSREDYSIRERLDEKNRDNNVRRKNSNRRSPSPVKRTRKYYSPVRKSSHRSSRYYSDSDSEDSSSESDSEEDSETSSESDSEEDSEEDSETSSESDYTSSSSESEEERSKSRHSRRDRKDRKDRKHKKEIIESRSSIENEIDIHGKSENIRNTRKLNKLSERIVKNEDVQDEDDSHELDTNSENGKKYSGPPRFLVLSVDGQFLGQKKIYTSNTGPKNAAQKAFNRLCNEMNKKMEITVKKLDDPKGKEMTYYFKKEELNPPIEREIGGRKVVYRHKTVSC
jgi:hypothetical protein